jgi:hypothetical protein
VANNPIRGRCKPPILELYYSGLAEGFICGLGARRIESMSIVVWKVMRQLPKPVLLVVLFFLLAAVCRA